MIVILFLKERFSEIFCYMVGNFYLGEKISCTKVQYFIRWSCREIWGPEYCELENNMLGIKRSHTNGSKIEISVKLVGHPLGWGRLRRDSLPATPYDVSLQPLPSPDVPRSTQDRSEELLPKLVRDTKVGVCPSLQPVLQPHKGRGRTWRPDFLLKLSNGMPDFQS